MKILKLHFKNLNSLLGEWTIDFTVPEFAEQGIFAITGPTGAGKSTLLDAICLALYGRTPRLDKINASQNEIMSRHSGECFASLEFQTNTGHYRTLWSQTRARKKAEGNLQAAQHVIEDLSDTKNKITLEDKLSKVPSKVSDVTGMDFEHFTRAMLLAQGGFAKFLHSPADERSPILEKITGTEVYSEISKKVHEHKALEENKLDFLQQQLQGIKILTSEEIIQLDAQLTNLEHELQANLKHKLSSEQQQIWLNNLCDLRQKLSELGMKQTELQLQKSAFAEQESALNWAQQASVINSDVYIALTQLRTQLQQLNTNIANSTERLPSLEQNSIELNNALSGSAQLLSQYKLTHAENLKLVQRVRQLDTQIDTATLQVVKVNQVVADGQSRLKDLAEQANIVQSQLINQKQQFASVNNYLEQNKIDANLVTSLSGINGRLDNFQRLAETLQKHHLHQQQTQVKADRLGQNLAELNQQQNSISQKTTAQQQELINLSQMQDNLSNGKTILSLTQNIAQLKAQQNELNTLAKLLSEQISLQHQTTNLEKIVIGENKILTEIKPQLLQTELSLLDVQQLLDSLNQQQLLLSKVADLTSERDKLRINQPCPLCGALEHPYANNLPLNDELDAQIDAAKLRQINLQATLNISNQQLTKSTTLIEQSLQQQTHINQKNTELNRQINELVNSHNLVNDDQLQLRVAENLLAIDAQIPEQEQLIEKLSSYEIQIKQLQLEQQQSLEHEQQLKIALIQLTAQLDASKTQLLQIQQGQEQAQTDLTTASQQLSTELLPYSIQSISLELLQQIKQQLHQRVENWQSQQRQAELLQATILQSENELQQNRVLQESINKSLQQTQLELAQTQAELANLLGERHKLFADQDTTLEESKWQNELESLEQNYQLAQSKFNQAQQQLNALKALLANQAEQLQPLQIQVQEQEELFSQNLTKAGFNDELDFKAKLLAREKIAAIQHMADQLKQTEIELKTQERQINEQIINEEKKHLTTQTIEELAAQIILYTQKIEIATQQIGAARLQLQLNQQAQQQQAETIARHEQQKVIHERWGNLHKLIGSADGKKFRNFAQGLTFEMVVKHANQQLQNMSERYLLIRDKDLPLELNVIDNYQGGEIRTTKNLSGGESFVISLALALGLSKLSSNKVQVDSLFLDEGFGTLDEESLQTALNALDSLQRDGKLIGVISHVGALKERINLQIQVEPLSGGVSRISGVGCSRK